MIVSLPKVTERCPVMPFLLLTALLLLLAWVPQAWVRHVLARHSRDVADLPGTGAELARHLLNRFELHDVTVEETEQGRDHYDPQANAVRLGSTAYGGRSLTAIATAAHEVGHAIQFNRNEPVSQLRRRYLGTAVRLQRLGAGLLVAMPLVTAVFRVPHAFLLMAFLGIATMLLSVAMYVAVLPEEWDASFNKALPILETGAYLRPEELPAARQILRACALTYVAAALADILNLGRWLVLLRGAR